MLLHGHKTSTKTPNLRAQGLARAGPDASADLASLLYAAASQHTAAAAREATAAGAARPAEARACSQPAPRSPEFTASGIAAARLGSARLAPPGSVPVGAELSSERTTSARRRLPGRSRRPFSPAAPHRGPRPSRTPSPPPGRLPRKPRTRSSAPRPAVGWGRAGDRPRRPRPRPAMPQP